MRKELVESDRRRKQSHPINLLVIWAVLGAVALAGAPAGQAAARPDDGSLNPSGGMISADVGKTASPAPQPAQPGNDPARELEERYGIRVERIKLTAAGNLLDFRYRVLDTAKAAVLFEKNVIPYLLDQATGAKMMIPAPDKVGALRTSGKNLIAGRVNFMLFGNPGCYIKPGRKVTVVIGDCQIKDLVVQ